MEQSVILILPLIAGYLLDLFIGDPYHWPHPVKLFGQLIAFNDMRFNQVPGRLVKGALISCSLCFLVFVSLYLALNALQAVSLVAYLVISSVLVFFSLANKSLITEGKNVFNELQMNGIEAGRKRLSWIVGRDTSQLTPQQIRIAVFETMSENLSDGVIAPLFYYLIAGVPGMMTYKMINTLDSMIGYRNDKYEYFGKFAARLDDVANYIPARITALLMVVVSLSSRGLKFVVKYGNMHKSPNSGYPESALAGILDVRFGGPNVYHGKLVEKPFIGENSREIQHAEFEKVAFINQKTTAWMVMIVALTLYFFR
jgi:adenosylcobinamide-phosphate synthase